MEVEGLSVKILEKLCQTIISNSNDLPEKLKNEIVKVNRKQFLSPPIDSGDLDVSKLKKCLNDNYAKYFPNYRDCVRS